MKQLFTLLLLISVQSLIAKESETSSVQKDSIPQTKVTWKFGGRIDVEIFANTYKGVESRNGLQYIAPVRPQYNFDGEDINKQSQLRMSAAPTRFNFTINATNILGADARGFIEVDFMGVSESAFNSLRMRHAYIDLQWKTRGLIIGQTSHLTMVNEVTPNTVTYGGGYPINPLNRPTQVQFRQDLCSNTNITVAAAMFGGTTGTEQSYAMIPDLQLRFTSGDPAKFVWGVGGGFKSLKPRTVTSNGSLANETISALNAMAFAKVVFPKNYALRLYGLWGQDLSALSILGGYAPKLADVGTPDYGYSPVAAVSSFADFESPISARGWQWGVFGGWQRNLGTADEVVHLQGEGPFLGVANNIPNFGLNQFWRIAPRVYYHYGKNLSFGLEYMFSSAQWGERFDDNYKPVEYAEISRDHRVTFLARYKF